MTRLCFSGFIKRALLLEDAENDRAVRALVDEVVQHLCNCELSIVIKLSRLNMSLDEKQTVAHLIVKTLSSRVEERFGLEGVACEMDEPQYCELPPEMTRTLLPHHDGGHCSFLTPPATNGVPFVRKVPTARYTTTDNHKIYQGLFLPAVGSGLSVTSYFDLVRIANDAFTFQHERQPDLAELMHWYGENVIRASQRTQFGYVPVGAQIGAKGAARDTAIHVWSDTHVVEGELLTTESIANTMTMTALGCNFEKFMERYSLLAPTEVGDLLIGHNLFAWHGGIEGGNGRLIQPMCITAQPSGDAYESWLAFHWQQFFCNRVTQSSSFNVC